MSDTNYIRKIKGNIASLFIHLGFWLDSSNKYRLAIIAYKIAIKLKSIFPVTYQMIGDTYSKMEKYELSVSYYKLSLDKFFDLDDSLKAIIPLNLELTLISIGGSYLGLKEYHKAVEYLTKAATDYDSQDFRCYGMLGNAYFGIEEYFQAINCFQTALKLNQDDDNALANIGKSYLVLSFKEKSLEYCKLSIISCYNALMMTERNILKIVELLFMVIFKNQWEDELQEMTEYQHLSKWFINKINNKEEKKLKTIPKQEYIVVGGGIASVLGKEIKVQEMRNNNNEAIYKIFSEDSFWGVNAESAIIHSVYPQHKKILQALKIISINGSDIFVDVITIKLPDGSLRHFTFDISHFFGK
jgi:tetratricopeptide (TPR) repeat protein